MTSYSYADRGGKKGAKKVLLNVNTNKTNVFSKNYVGLKYTGTTIFSSNKTASGSTILTGANTYKKGNTIYIQPTKTKVLVPELKKGYSGVKLIIRSH